MHFSEALISKDGSDVQQFTRPTSNSSYPSHPYLPAVTNSTFYNTTKAIAAAPTGTAMPSPALDCRPAAPITGAVVEVGAVLRVGLVPPPPGTDLAVVVAGGVVAE
jgi:hypothetical protein